MRFSAGFLSSSNTTAQGQVQVNTIAEQLPLYGQMRALSIQRTAVTVQQCQDFNLALLIGSYRQFAAGLGLVHCFLESLFLRS